MLSRAAISDLAILPQRPRVREKARRFRVPHLSQKLGRYTGQTPDVIALSRVWVSVRCGRHRQFGYRPAELLPTCFSRLVAGPQIQVNMLQMRQFF